MKKINLFLDTNTFLHYKSIDEIDWRKVVDCDEVTLVLALVVVSELDKKKYEATGRVREKAKTTVARLNAYSKKPAPIIIRDRVFLQFLNFEPEIDYAANQLDKSNQDDRLLASVIEFRRENPRLALKIVSGDLGLSIKARLREIEVLELGNESKLPDEPDPLEKKYKQLEKT
jgi:predicted ribonuclease YlaK